LQTSPMQLRPTCLLMVALALKVSGRLLLEQRACIETGDQRDIFKGEDCRDPSICEPKGLERQVSSY
jgi:hypothetical protein